ncbi:MAG: S8 family serine peptidase [Candidatus Hatepunaea meridiana]|nr:S8 family serine peptidase [Candidatus Hatepunaea meridiana]
MLKMFQYDYKLLITSRRSANRISTNPALRLGGMSNISIIVILAFITFLNIAHATLKPRWTPPKPEHTKVDSNYYQDCLTIKFVEGSRVRLRNSKLVSLTGRNLTNYNKVIRQYRIRSLTRLFSRAEHLLDAEREIGQQRSGKQLGDLNNYYRVILDSTENPEDFINNLNRLGVIEIAYPEPKYYAPFEDIPPPTPDFTEHQGYLYEAPGGIDAPAAWDFPGGKGEGIRIISIDGPIGRYDHEDLKEPFYINRYNNAMGAHSTSVLGIMISQHNGYGMDGICPEVEIGSYEVHQHDDGYPNLADGINQIADTLREGDIFTTTIGIFIDWVVNNIECFQANFDAVSAATANGRICAAAAGNDGGFIPNFRHSGSISVGAGAPPSGNFGPDRSRLRFSNYGQRVELQGWGEEVGTTCGSLWRPDINAARQGYGNTFSGTSGATPIVAGAIACIQGITKARTGGRWTLNWRQMRDLLVETGSPQQDGPNGMGHIGPRPNLAEAIEHIPYPFGVLYGNVSDFETDEPIEGALIRTPCEEEISDVEGNWIIEQAVALDNFTITASIQGYNETTIERDFNEDDTLEVDFSLYHPEFDISVENFNEQLFPDSTIDVIFEIRNDGNGPLEWSVEKHLIGIADLYPWELRRSHPVGLEAEDYRLQGVIFANEHFYISGGAHETNYIYVFNRDGRIINCFPQLSNSRYGMSDLAWDGELIWGSGERNIYGFTTGGDSVVCWEGPFNVNNALAWDSDSNQLWIASITSNYIIGYDREGAIRDSLERYGFRIYGLSYWIDDPDGYKLYVYHSPSEERQVVHKIDTDNRDTLFVAELTPEDGGRPGGAFITDRMDIYSWVFIALSNAGRNDRIDIWQLERVMDWFDVDTTEGRITAGDNQELVLTLDATGLDSNVYEGELLINHNAAGGSTSIEITLTIEPNEINESERQLPTEFGITSIYPNPFNSTTRIMYNIEKPSIVSLKVFDVSGRKVASLIDNELSAGHHSVIWETKEMPSGVFFFKLEACSKVAVGKTILIR